MDRATLIELHAFSAMRPERKPVDELLFEIDGVVGDRHRGHLRKTYAADPQPKGTMRRNERMWSAIASEELSQIATDMGLAEPLTPADVSVNMCFEGYATLSQLPAGTRLCFPSGLELHVEGFCAPCLDKGRKLASAYRKANGEALKDTDFSKAAARSRGLIGVVEVPGMARAGDLVEIRPAIAVTF